MSNKVIRGDGPMGRIETRALAVDWGLRTVCYVEGCEEPITTIAQQDSYTYALCEAHYQAANVPGGTTLKIVL